MLSRWFGAKKRSAEEGAGTVATIEWSPDGLIERVNRLHSRVEALEKTIKSTAVADDPDGPEEERKTTAARIKAMRKVAQTERDYHAAISVGDDVTRWIEQLVVIDDPVKEPTAEALLRGTCEGDAAHETPIKTGSANADVAHGDAEVP